MLQACRGKHFETLAAESVSESVASPECSQDACRILLKPNKENTIVFYSAVESKNLKLRIIYLGSLC